MADQPILLNSSGDVTHIIDDFIVCSWDRILGEVDTMTLHIPSTSALSRVIEPDMMIVVPDDPPIAHHVEQISVTRRGADTLMEITGRTLDRIFDIPGRVVVPPALSAYYESTGPAETVMKDLVRSQAGSTASAGRSIPTLDVAADAAQGSTVTINARYESVLEWLQKIGAIDFMGWEVTYNYTTGRYTFDVIVGEDRASQIIFDFEMDAIKALDWFRTSASYASYAFAAGEGTGETRLFIEGYVGDEEPTGFDRKEVFIDAGQVGDVLALGLEADAELIDAARQETFVLDVNPFGPFRYREDWDLGDIVTVRDEMWGVEYISKIVAVHASVGPTSLRPLVSVEIGKPAPNLRREIQKTIRRQKGTA